MSDIIGIIPGAGRATRIGGFFKELTPINVDPNDISKFIVLCEQMIQNLEEAGASPVFFVINSEKQLISDYFNRLSLFTNDDLYFSHQGQVDLYYGLPFAIDKIYNQAIGKTVLMGMPDTLIEPRNSFITLLANFKKHKADIELGLYKTNAENHGGYIEYDKTTNVVLNHIDKTHKDFPTEKVDNAWAIACWNSNFTEFMHKFIENSRENYRYSGFGQRDELLFGDIIDAALKSKQIKVCADFIDIEKGYYLDISEPKKYFQAVLHYHSNVLGKIKGEKALPFRSDKPDKGTGKSIFISHSSKQKVYADDLHFYLQTLGYNPILDSYEIAGGEKLTKKIERLITDCEYFVLLISKDTLSSLWVQTEITLALAKGMIDSEKFIPVQVEELTLEDENKNPIIPKNSYNWIDGTKGFRKAITDIAKAIEKS
jgi:hypothetical protein